MAAKRGMSSQVLTPRVPTPCPKGRPGVLTIWEQKPSHPMASDHSFPQLVEKRYLKIYRNEQESRRNAITPTS